MLSLINKDSVLMPVLEVILFWLLPNFQYLPREELYMPPMNIKVRDNRSFGRKPVVGLCSLKSLHRYRREPRSQVDGPDLTGLKKTYVTLRRRSNPL